MMKWRAFILNGGPMAYWMLILAVCKCVYADDQVVKQSLVMESLPQGESPPAGIAKWQSFLTPEGQWRVLKLTDVQGQGWAIPPGRVLWAGVLTEEAAKEARTGLQMIGQITESESAIEEITAVKSPSGILVIPAGLNLAKSLDWTAFGIEERVRACREEDPSCWQMRPGVRPAGLYSALRWRLPRWPSVANWTLSLGLQGHGRVEVGLSADLGKGFGEPQTLGSIDLTEAAQRQQWKIPSKWLKAQSLRLTLAGEPSADTQVQIQEVICAPVLEAKQRVKPFSSKLGIWDWSAQPSQWQERQALWQKAKVSVLQLALPRTWENEEVSRGVRSLKEDGFEIKVVEGDPQMVLPSEVEGVVAKNRGLNERFKHSLKAVQYDVEPYVLPGFRLSTERWYQQWSGLFQRLHAKDHAALEAVVPFWLLNQPQGQVFLSQLAKHVQRVVVMNYRTDPVEAISWASAWLEWGAENRCAVSLALECGPIPDLPLRLFKPADAGQLWVRPFPGLGTVAVYYAEKVSHDPGLSDALIMDEVRKTSVPGQRTTWKDRPAKDVVVMIESLQSLISQMKLPAHVSPELLLHEPSEDLLRFLAELHETK